MSNTLDSILISLDQEMTESKTKDNNIHVKISDESVERAENDAMCRIKIAEELAKSAEEYSKLSIKDITIKNYNKFKYIFKEYDNFITEEERIYFLKNIEKNKFIEDNPLKNYSFKNTKGLLIEFSRSNDYEEFKVNGLNFLYNYYKKIRKPYATDFILNILIIDAINEKDNNNILKKNSVDYHRDTTLELVDNSEFIKKDIVPECVSVLYVDLPKNFKKGNLKLILNKKNGEIKPEKRKLAEFNGILIHGVEKIIDTDNNNGRRISIVLEQYIKK